MKHLIDMEAARFELDSAGIEVTERALTTMVAHLNWLLDTNRRVNLTAVTDPGDAIRLHLLDSLCALPEVIAAPAGDAIDIGTGGGFPGLPLAIASGRPFTLLDSVRKKAAALRSFLDEAGVDLVRVEAGRSEQLARSRPEAYSLVVARAVASLPSLLELASPLLTVGGRLIAMKGRPESEELEGGDAAARLVGMCRIERGEYRLPGGEARVILVYEKCGSPSLVLPRREGLAQRRPLA